MLGKKDTEKEEEELTEAEIESEIRRLGWRKRSRKKVEKDKDKEESGGNEMQEPPRKRKRRWKVNYAVKRKEECEGAVSNMDHHHYKRRKIENVENKSEETEVVRENIVQQIQEGRHQPMSSSSVTRKECDTMQIQLFTLEKTKIHENSNNHEVKNETEESTQTNKVYPIFTAQFKPQGNKKKTVQLKTKANPASQHYHPPKGIRNLRKNQLRPNFKFKRLEEYFNYGPSGNTKTTGRPPS